MPDDLTPEPTDETAKPAPVAVAKAAGIDLNALFLNAVQTTVKMAPWAGGIALIIAAFFHFAGPSIDRYFDIKEKECASLQEVTTRLDAVETQVKSLDTWSSEHERKILGELTTINRLVTALATAKGVAPAPGGDTPE